jgi:hypothetical protein
VSNAPCSRARRPGACISCRCWRLPGACSRTRRLPAVEGEDEIRLRWREQIERGWLEAQTGRVVDGAAAMGRIRQRLKTRSKRR